MDTKSLINEAKARFSHNAAKSLLKDKYESKLIVADQGGLWKATPELIGFLSINANENIVLIDSHNNPVLVNRVQLYNILHKIYTDTMNLWLTEWKELETKR
jgi:hypothetical protein